MIAFLGIGFRFLEIGVIAAALLLMGLLFIPRRPPGLVWVSVAAMGVLLVHLYLEQGRWQLVPIYAVVFGLSIWLAVPGRKRYGTGGLAFRVVLIVFLLTPSLTLPLVVPLFVVPPPTGPYGVGVAALLVTRVDGGAAPGSARMSVTVHYPRDQVSGGNAGAGGAIVAPYWSLGDVVSNRLPGLPWLASTHLVLVPTNSVLRGRRADGSFPVAIAIRSPASLPSDYVVLTEQIASLGWIVVEVSAAATSVEIVWLLDQLQRGRLDSAFDGVVDTNRAVLLALGWDPGYDVGLPIIRVGGSELLSVVTAGGSYGIVLPDSRIPDDALTNRYLMVRPARLLVGSSDVSPTDLNTLLTRAVSALMSDGRLSAAVFTAEPAQTALSEALRAHADLLPGLTIRSRPGVR
ncbi:MAG: hypothetical protein V3S41_07825 [Spirochaetia bacterium]